jgi:caffeoyl-CoA O-methyltransferase
MHMTSERWERTAEYLSDVFGRPDEQLATLMGRAVAAGLPDIAVSADVGRLLKLLTEMACAGTGIGGRPSGPQAASSTGMSPLAIELGTLAGYSGIWIARGLGARGKLVTVEIDEKHLRFARGEFARAGVAERVELVRGAALEVLPKLVERFGPASVDVAFLDAVKTEYAEYARVLKPMLRPGGLLIADNSLGSSWWIDQPPGSDPQRDAVDRFNRMMAEDQEFETACIANRQGVLVARRRG